MLPGKYLRFAAERLLPPRSFHLVVDPAIADLQHEWQTAKTGVVVHTRVLARGYAATARLLAWTVAADLASGASARIATRSLNRIAIPAVAMTLFFMWVFGVFDPRGRPFTLSALDALGRTVAMLPMLLATPAARLQIPVRDVVRISLVLWAVGTASSMWAAPTVWTTGRALLSTALFVYAVSLGGASYRRVRAGKSALGTALLLGHAVVLLTIYTTERIAPLVTPDVWSQRVAVCIAAVISSAAVLVATLLMTPSREDSEGLSSPR